MDIFKLTKSKARKEILRLFIAHPENKYYLRELEKILKISVGNVRRELLSLEKLGLFQHQTMGKQSYYYLNTESPIFEELKKIISKTINNEGPSDIFQLAKEWAISGSEFGEQFYCQNSGIFQARLTKMQQLMLKDEYAKNLFSLLTSIAGEIGNNSYDHNLGQWPDMPGIFFGYDLNKKQIVLADRGVGILETLKRVRPELKDHKDALRLAFTEIVSGREPEARGNGLKYVRKVVAENTINLMFQTGDAKLIINGNNKSLNIETVKEKINGCLALITY